MIPKVGANLNGYRLINEFSEHNAGNCLWSIAQKNGREYFIKRYIKPIYPTEDALGSESTKKRNLHKSLVFEQKQLKIQKLLKNESIDGGNLVITKDFFRIGSHYYKVTDKVDIEPGINDNLYKFDINKKIILLKTLTHSLRTLHTINLVHGDIKTDNILIKMTIKDLPVAKLIDYDDGFFEYDPPLDPEELVGDPVYYSPEMLYFINNSASPKSLTVKSDIFALGLVFHQFLTGNLPIFDQKKYVYAHEAVISNGLFVSKELLPTWICGLLESMLEKEYHRRPDIHDVFKCLLLEQYVGKNNESIDSKLKGDLVKRTSIEHGNLKGKGLDLIKK